MHSVQPRSGDSILFPATFFAAAAAPSPAEPPFFADLHLDEIVAAALAGRDEYHLAELFYQPLKTAEEIAYRQEIMRDVQAGPTLAAFRAFSGQMARMRRHLATAETIHFAIHKHGYILEAATVYSRAVAALHHALGPMPLESRGLRDFRTRLGEYVQSENFQTLTAMAENIQSRLRAIIYCIRIQEDLVTVSRYAGEADFGQEVQHTFARFQQGTVRDYTAALAPGDSMNHVEVRILALVARLHPDLFADLETFCAKYPDFPADIVVQCEREIQFFMAWVEFTGRVAQTGLRFCYPQILVNAKSLAVREGFDLALATHLLPSGAAPVCNDLTLNDPERIIVVSGPNQGGKTTFARMLGQLHYLASLGCTVPAVEAKLGLVDGIFTHFERPENFADLRGKLQDDLLRLRDIVRHATGHSMVILNEIFSSTSARDGLYLATRMIAKLAELQTLCVCVTFLDELSRLNDHTVSVVAGVAPADPTQRTFRLERHPADGNAYALAVAQQHHLTYAQIKRRLTP